MVLFLTLSLLSGILFSLEGRHGMLVFVRIYFIAFGMLILASLDILFGGVAALKSDELYYIEIAQKLSFSDILSKDRSVWHIINYWVLNFDIGFNGLSLKVLNIPLFALFTLVLYRISNRNPAVWLLPIFLPYTLWTATFNFRDILIFLLTAMIPFILYQIRSKSAVLAVFPLILLFYLRPFSAFLVFTIIAIFESYVIIFSTWKGIFKKRFLIPVTASVILSLIIFMGFWEPIIKVTHKYILWFFYTTGEGREQHIARYALSYKTSSIVGDYLLSLLRYVFTPIPSSLIVRFLNGGSELWGRADDLIRIINQTIYYLMLIYLLINIQSVIYIYRKMTRAQRVFIVSFLSYWPIYSFHLYGATHQRLKLPFQIVVFLFFIMVRYSKLSFKQRPSRLIHRKLL